MVTVPEVPEDALEIGTPGETVTAMGSIDDTDMQWDRVSAGCFTQGDADHYYDTVAIVNNTGAGQFINITATWSEGADGYLHIYRLPFDPESTDGCIVGDDDFDLDGSEGPIPAAGASQIEEIGVPNGAVLMVVLSTFNASDAIGPWNLDITTLEPNAVFVDDQLADPANMVVVDEVVTADGGFIAVHEDDGNGGIGGVIGVSDFIEPGRTFDVEVTLDRDAVDGETLYAMLHSDDGNETYEFPGPDGPVTDSNGDVIAPAFVVALPILNAVEVNDQSLFNPSVVTVAEVLSDEGGFIAIHEDNNGSVGGVIGVSAFLEAGFSFDVPVMLDRPAVDGETLYAMLHSDDGNETYEFPGPDGPVVDNAGEVIAPAFVVSVAAPAPVLEIGPQGEVVSIMGSIDVTDPQWDRPFGDCSGSGAADHHFDVIRVENNTGADQMVRVTGMWEADGYLHAFTPPFDPTNRDNCVVGDDDFDLDGAGPLLPANGSQIDEIAIPNGGALMIVATAFGSNEAIGPWTIEVETLVPNAVMASDQTVAAPDLVIVDEVVTENGGFIAIHENGGGGNGGISIGGVIGVSDFLAAGTHLNVPVTLDRPAVDGETLFAMLHSDDGNETYEFPGPDGPVLDGNGEVIAPAFVVTVPVFAEPEEIAGEYGESITLTGSIDDTDPQWDRPSASCAAQGDPDHYFDVVQIVNNTPEFQIVDITATFTAEGVDGYMHIFEPPFVPNILDNCIQGDDDHDVDGDGPLIGRNGSQLTGVTLEPGEGLFVILSTFDPNDPIGPWSLDVTTAFPPGEPNDVTMDAEPIAVDELLQRGLERAGDVDFYTFTVMAESTFTIETFRREDAPAVDTQMWLCDDSDLENCTYQGLGAIANNDDISFPSNPYSRLTEQTLVPGTYYIGVRGFEGDTGAYDIILELTGIAGMIPVANFGESATAMGSIDDTDMQWDRPSAACSGSGPADHYFDVVPIVNDTNGIRVVDITASWTGGGDGYMHVFSNGFRPDNFDACIEGDDDGPGGLSDSQVANFELAPGELVFVVLSTFDPNDPIGAWDLEIFTHFPPGEPNDATGDAEEIGLGDTLQRAIEVEGDVDFYVFEATFPMTVTIDTFAPMGDGSEVSDTVLWLCGEGDLADCTFEGASNIASDDDGGAGNYSSITDVELMPGVYYIGVAGFGSLQGGYDISLMFENGGPNEPNDDFSEATPFTFGGTTTASFEFDGDEDWYTFTLDDARLIDMFTADPMLDGGENVDTVIFICDDVDPGSCAQFNSIDSDDDSLAPYSAISGLALQAGTYYVAVIAPFGNATGDYSLTIRGAQ